MKIKLWALVDKKGEIENEAYFNGGGSCCCVDEPRAVAVYDSLEEAENSLGTGYTSEVYSIVEMDVTYEFKRKRKKRK